MENYKFRYKQKLIEFYNYLIENKIQKSVFLFYIEFISEVPLSTGAATMFYEYHTKSNLENIIHLNGAATAIHKVKIIETTGATHFKIIGEVSLSNKFYSGLIKDKKLPQPGDLNNHNLW